MISQFASPLFPWHPPMTEDLFRRSIDMAMDAGGGALYLPADFSITQDLSDLSADAGQVAVDGEASKEGDAGETFAAHVNEKKRTVDGVANVLEVSRTGIRISIEGLDLSHFKKNPVALAGHMRIGWDGSPTVIATINSVSKAKKNTVLRFRGMTFDVDPLADAWFQKILGRFIRMVSVGILPTDIEIGMMEVGRGKDKREILFLDIIASELLEISPVSIGANHGAFIGESSAALRLAARVAEQSLAIDRLEEALDVASQSDLNSSRKQLSETLERIEQLQSR